jgi:hypothetical protein
MAIKGISFSSKSLFLKLNQEKHTCLMVKENKHKVKINDISSPKYVFSDDDAPFPNGINEKAIIKKLGKELVSQDQLLKDQEDLLEKERKNTCELKRLLKLEKEKNEELVQCKETISNLKSSSGALQDSYDVLQRLIVIPHSEKERTKPPYVCPGCSNHTYSNNMITRFYV